MLSSVWRWLLSSCCHSSIFQEHPSPWGCADKRLQDSTVWALGCTPGKKDLSSHIPVSCPGYQSDGSFREGIFHPEQNLRLKSISWHISLLRQCFPPKMVQLWQIILHWWQFIKKIPRCGGYKPVCLFVCAVGARGWVTATALLEAGQHNSCCDRGSLGMHEAPASSSCATNTGAACFFTEIPF